MLDWQTGEPNAKYWVTNLLVTTVGDSREKSVKSSKVTSPALTAEGAGGGPPGSSDPVYVMPYEKGGHSHGP